MRARVDLGAADAERLPEAENRLIEIVGVALPRLAVAAGAEALPGVLALITSGRLAVESRIDSGAV